MSKLRVLNFQYLLSKKLLFKPVKRLSVKDRQASDLMLSFHPNIDEMRRVFQKMSNKDGRITAVDLRRILSALGADHDAELMVRVADLDRDGSVDFGEFMEVHRKGVRTGEIQSAFWAFDRDGDGRISAEEVWTMMDRLGERCSLEDCQRMVRRVDKNGDGLVDMDDFMAMMTRTMKLA